MAKKSSYRYVDDILRLDKDISIPLPIVAAMVFIFLILNTLILYCISSYFNFANATIYNAFLITLIFAIPGFVIYTIMYSLRQGGRIITAYIFGIIFVIVLFGAIVYMMFNYYNLTYAYGLAYFLPSIIVSGVIAYWFVVVILMGRLGYFNKDVKDINWRGKGGYKK